MALQSMTLTLKLSLKIPYFSDWWGKLNFCYLQDKRFYQMAARVFQNLFLRWDLTFPVKRAIKLPISARHWHVLVARFAKKQAYYFTISLDIIFSLLSFTFKSVSLIVFINVSPWQQNPSFACSILVYSRKTVLESSKISVEHARYVAKIFIYIYIYYISVRLLQRARLWPAV